VVAPDAESEARSWARGSVLSLEVVVDDEDEDESSAAIRELSTLELALVPLAPPPPPW